ncbi:MAG: hypothetical protein KGK03_06715 [Candidatus Omnitrophica bacterium]|nr:hypothetical protein [Candidatus Omnitrophota bacterium]
MKALCDKLLSQKFMGINYCLWIVCLFGILLRTAQYLYNRSLWLDELSLSINLIQCDFKGLFLPLSSHQLAPFGFLVLQKWAVMWLGPNGWGLRLVPLMSGICAVLLFAKAASMFLDRYRALLAGTFFALCGSLIYYSSEAKQYSTDVLVVVILLLIFGNYLNLRKSGKMTAVNAAILGLMAAVSVWFSYTAAFVIGGLAVAVFIMDLSKGEAKYSPMMVLPALLVIFSLFCFGYLSFCNYFHGVPGHYRTYWKDDFLPLWPLNFWNFIWIIEKFDEVFKYPGGFYYTGIAAFCYFVGLKGILTKDQTLGFGLIYPILLILLASGLKLYPFAERLILFLVPLIIIPVASGLVDVMEIIQRWSRGFAIFLAVLLLFHPAFAAGYHLFHPRTREEIQKVMNYVKQHYESGDELYFYYPNKQVLDFYGKSILPKQKNSYVAAQGYVTFTKDLVRFKGDKRVWVIFSHLRQESDRLAVLTYLDSIGRCLMQYETKDFRMLFTLKPEISSAAYLYDLGSKP